MICKADEIRPKCSDENTGRGKGGVCFFPLFPVVNYLARLGRERFRSTLKQNGLYPGQEEILFAVKLNAGIKPLEIANKLSTSLASVSVSLKRLEKAGFIVKEPDENDARTNHIYLSEKAEEALENIRIVLGNYESDMISGFKKEELDNLRIYLDRLIYNASGVEDYSYKRPSLHRKGME